ncbi:leukocyte elastase inhibitor-like [Pyxicephalus adspersus]|uniref:leukocyte elastase inhibitor-like n=1 Tax=Pyxicephalus adspersus TaxID=30357 RepID=UPI003B5906DF
MESLVISYNNISKNLYQELIDKNDQNECFSPLAIASVLTMIELGKGGETDDPKAENLGGVPIQNITKAFEELYSKINQPSNNFILKSVSGLYSDYSVPVAQQYKQQMKNVFQAEIQTMDFAHSADDARKKINNWVEEQTDSKIKDILPEDSVDSLTKLVLLNAFFFKGNWDAKFPEENTKQKPFRLSKTKTKMVPMMSQRNKFNLFHIEELRTLMVELPFENDDLRFIALMPDDIEDNTTGLEQLQKELSYAKLNEWMDRMTQTEVEIELPRFRLENNYNLKPYLSKMGMADLFSPGKADLRGISEADNLHVSEIFHKVILVIDEEGTEAAAATGDIATVSTRPIAEKVQADHPFMFIIMHTKTKSILLFGAVTSP